MLAFSLLYTAFLYVCGSGNGTQEHSTSELHLQPIFLFFYSKQGLTKLQRAPLSSWGCPQTSILLSQSPKSWNYKPTPPHQALFYVFLKGKESFQNSLLQTTFKYFLNEYRCWGYYWISLEHILKTLSHWYFYNSFFESSCNIS